MRPTLFRGTATALVTPFTADGALDDAALRRHIDAQIAGGVEALVLLGSTGENPTITLEERRHLTALTVAHIARRVPVLVGAGTNDTRTSVQYAQEAAAAGADGLLIVTPYYNKPSLEGLVLHLMAIAEATPLPLILYNVPSRTGQNIPAEWTLRIAQRMPRVVGIKEASSDLAQISDILAKRPPDFAVYAGDDELALPTVALGAEGVISVVSNVFPDRFSTVVRQALAGDFAAARAGHFALLPAMRACFYGPNPVPVKTVLAGQGQMKAAVRLPLTGLTEDVQARVMRAFAPLVRPPQFEE